MLFKFFTVLVFYLQKRPSHHWEGLLGKSIGEDLEDGRITLPLILALKNTSDRKSLEKAIKDCDLAKVLTFIKETDSLSKCRNFAFEAVEKAKKALEILEDSPYKKMLVELAKKAANRSK